MKKGNFKKGTLLFAGFNSMEELYKWISMYNGSEGVIAVSAMMQTLQTINNIEDRELKEKLSQLKIDTKKTMEKING